MGMPPMRVMCAFFLALICVNHMSSLAWALEEQPNSSQSQWRSHTRGNSRHNIVSSVTPTPPTVQHNEIKELMANLHDRVGILATLDEDQRHRLELIDKKVDQLLDGSAGRMESLKVQQLNFQQRLDSFEHIQRLTRSTLDELKDLSRKVRATPQESAHESPQEPPYVAQNMANIFNIPPTNVGSLSNNTELDINRRLEGLATLLVSVAYNVRETQQNVGRLVQNTNNLKRRLANRVKAQSARLPQLGQVGSPASLDEHATSCLQSYLAVNGILKLQLTPESEPFYVPCEDDGWTVIMNRSADDISFERSWLEYREGFGNLAGDFFIGLDKLHALTSSSLHELRIWLEDFNGNVALAGYDAFAISGERELYTLSLLGQFQRQLQPSAGDSLSYHAGAKFSTFDNDNDNCVECNCAQRHKAGGWFNSCGTSNLMGIYHTKQPEQAGETGIYWDTFQGKDYSLRSVKMLIRPVTQDEARR